MAKKRTRRSAPPLPRELKTALRRVGTKVGVARRLGVSPSTIYRWFRYGVPAREASPARGQLDTLAGALREERVSSRQDKALFDELSAAAAAEHPEDVPRVRPGEGVRSGRLTQGYQWTKRIDRMLTVEVMDEIAAWMMTLNRRYPIWQAVVVASQYATDPSLRFIGKGPDLGSYKTVVKQLGAKGTPVRAASGEFAMKSEIPTSRNTSRMALIEDLDSRLIGDLPQEEPGGPRLLVFIHAVTIFNYRRRTPEEQRSWATREKSRRRKAREKKEAQWPKKKTKKRTKKRALSKKAKSRRRPSRQR